MYLLFYNPNTPSGLIKLMSYSNIHLTACKNIFEIGVFFGKQENPDALEFE